MCSQLTVLNLGITKAEAVAIGLLPGYLEGYAVVYQTPATVYKRPTARPKVSVMLLSTKYQLLST